MVTEFEYQGLGIEILLQLFEFEFIKSFRACRNQCLRQIKGFLFGTVTVVSNINKHMYTESAYGIVSC